MSSSLNVRKAIRNQLLPNPEQYKDTDPLNLPSLKQIWELKGQANRKYIKLDYGIPTYQESDMPLIHVSMGDITTNQLAIDSRSRSGEFTLMISYFATVSVKDNKLLPFKSVQREELLTYLEDSALEIDNRIFEQGVDRVSFVTLFNQEAVEFVISEDAAKSSVIGVSTLRYKIGYGFRF